MSEQEYGTRAERITIMPAMDGSVQVGWSVVDRLTGYFKGFSTHAEAVKHAEWFAKQGHPTTEND